MSVTGVRRIRSVPIESLSVGDSPRSAGEDLNHTRLLAGVPQKLPPIVVHAATMRVIDGMHRLSVARLRGEKMIEVEFFDGSESEAFVLAVRANTQHGLPLSFDDRLAAATRIIGLYPGWSDRMIAAAAGVSAYTVGAVRRRARGDDEPLFAAGSTGLPGASAEGPVGTAAGAEAGAAVRVGRDGRARPVDGAAGRLRAGGILARNPQASLRQVAEAAGVSPATVRDVRERLRRGEDPVPPAQRRGPGTRWENAATSVPTRSITAAIQGLCSDPSLRFSESGRALLRWLTHHAVNPGEWSTLVGDVPPHAIFILTEVAHHCAEEWRRLAEFLEAKNQQRFQASEPSAGQ